MISSTVSSESAPRSSEKFGFRFDLVFVDAHFADDNVVYLIFDFCFRHGVSPLLVVVLKKANKKMSCNIQRKKACSNYRFLHDHAAADVDDFTGDVG